MPKYLKGVLGFAFVLSIVLFVVAFTNPSLLKPPSEVGDTRKQTERVSAANSRKETATRNIDQQRNVTPLVGAAELRPTIPADVAALPSTPGFNLDPAMPGGKAAEALAAQSRDPIWANVMESRINDELVKRDGLRASNLKVECRMSACGMLVTYTPGDDLREQKTAVKDLARSMREALGFKSGGTSTMQLADGTTYTFVSLSDATGREQYLPVNESPTIPALPGMSGFDIPVPGNTSLLRFPAEALAAEPAVQSPWSNAMKTSINTEALAVAGAHVNQIQVECREKTCGVVFVYPKGAGPVDVREMSNHLAKAVGLAEAASARHANEQFDFVTVYLQRNERH